MKPLTGNSDEWYTPAWVTDLARKSMGGIDLDPASCEHANRAVRATEYYTIEDDGLARTWSGRVWCNPPYSEKPVWARKCIREYIGDVDALCLLVPASIETDWFRMIWHDADCVVVLPRRVAFGGPPGQSSSSNPGPSVVALWGDCRLAPWADVGCIVLTEWSMKRRTQERLEI